MQQNWKSARHAKVTCKFIKIRPHDEKPTIPHVHVHARQCGFRESRSYTAACSPWLWITSTTQQCEQNWKCQIRLLPRLCICAHVWFLLYVYTHIYTRRTYTGWSA